jgi:Alpha-L-arabinofuranosidase B, catalytic
MRTKSKSSYRGILSTSAVIAVLVMSLAGVCSAQARSSGPCDVYSTANTACAAAFSTTRALYGSYTGSLYQVTRQSDNTTTNIEVLSDGHANAATQDTFCAKSLHLYSPRGIIFCQPNYQAISGLNPLVNDRRPFSHEATRLAQRSA